MKVRAAVLRRGSRNASEPQSPRHFAGLRCHPHRPVPGPARGKTRDPTPANSGPAAGQAPSRVPRCSPARSCGSGARGHRGGASSALRAQDRHIAAGVGRAAQAARSHPDPARQARRHPALPPPHPGPHLPFSWTRGVFATPVPRTGAPPRRGRSEPLVRTRNPAALEHAQRAPDERS